MSGMISNTPGIYFQCSLYHLQGTLDTLIRKGKVLQPTMIEKPVQQQKFC